MVDVDHAMEKILETYKSTQKGNLELNQLFGGADLDEDGMIGFYEFMCLCKYIEGIDKERKDVIAVEKLFFKKCDLISQETGEKALSLDQFISLATQNGFFRPEKVLAFSTSNLNLSDCQNIAELQ